MYETPHYAPPRTNAKDAATQGRSHADPTGLPPYVALEPMLLPWLGRKAGISDTLCRWIWQKADIHAREHAVFGSANYFKLAIDGLLRDLVTLSRAHGRARPD